MVFFRSEGPAATVRARIVAIVECRQLRFVFGPPGPSHLSSPCPDVSEPASSSNFLFLTQGSRRSVAIHFTFAWNRWPCRQRSGCPGTHILIREAPHSLGFITPTRNWSQCGFVPRRPRAIISGVDAFFINRILIWFGSSHRFLRASKAPASK